MEVNLIKAELADAEILHRMQVEAFMPLLRKYQDHALNPAMESLDRLIEKIQQPNSAFYLIRRGGQSVGGVRVVDLDGGCQCRISPIFILSAFQSLGIAQQALRLLERLHRPQGSWCLDSILEEAGNCRLYEKLGFIQVGPARRVQPGMHLVSYRKEVVSCA
ncbi:GNAT family N-acetyltransferase [Chromobacterium piscinae]|uniref:GNAT family N-acetyltransferase n=1 Tax=Chromobacterium piscinae TaxID=686831 RepID=A0ABV0H5P5_9NEIS|nr:GNAT family N-acetyltransferase [Chromobacterium vaccinii]